MVRVQKINGEFESYNPKKLRKSLLAAGADDQIVVDILDKVKTILHDGVTTKELYRFIFKEFKKHAPTTSSKYTLKNAILHLGPSGYPFEKYVAKMFERQGYTTKVGVLVKGKRITHEIDVIAVKGKEKLLIECKYHNHPWVESGIHVPLYVYARFLDLKSQFTHCMVVTNTRFSPQCHDYASGIGMRLMSWNYPISDSLKSVVERLKLYPITMMNSLDRQQSQILLAERHVLVSSILKFSSKQLMSRLGISEVKANKILAEAKALK